MNKKGVLILALILTIPLILAFGSQNQEFNLWEWIKNLFSKEVNIQESTNLSNSSLYFKNINISFIKVNNEDKQLFLDYLNDVNDWWFYNINKISVFGDKELFTSHSGCLAERGLIGCNLGNGKIKIYFKASEYLDNSIKAVICHELLHTYIPNSGGNKDQQIHKIVYDIGNSEACFK
jgi:hypothetical protein